MALAILLIAAILALGWWVVDGSTTRPRNIRSRLTIVVDTSEGERSGSSVTQNTISFPGGLTRAQGWAVIGQIVGEVVVVDLGARGLLFSTFEKQTSLSRGGGGGYNAGLTPFPREKFRGVYPAGASTNEEYAACLDELDRLKPKSELSLKDIPIMVRFGNPKDPTSVELVDPLDLAASFEAGVTFKRAIVEITDDPVTKGIEIRLSWLKSSKDAPRLLPTYPGRQTDAKAVRNLTYDDFRSLPR